MESWGRRVGCREGREGRERGGPKRWPASERWADWDQAQLRPLRPLPWGSPTQALARGACGGLAANLGLRWGWGGRLHLHPSWNGNSGHPAKAGAGGQAGTAAPPTPSPSRRRGGSVTRPQETGRSNT